MPALPVTKSLQEILAAEYLRTMGLEAPSLISRRAPCLPSIGQFNPGIKRKRSYQDSLRRLEGSNLEAFERHQQRIRYLNELNREMGLPEEEVPVWKRSKKEETEAQTAWAGEEAEKGGGEEKKCQAGKPERCGENDAEDGKSGRMASQTVEQEENIKESRQAKGFWDVIGEDVKGNMYSRS